MTGDARRAGTFVFFVAALLIAALPIVVQRSWLGWKLVCTKGETCRAGTTLRTMVDRRHAEQADLWFRRLGKPEDIERAYANDEEGGWRVSTKSHDGIALETESRPARDVAEDFNAFLADRTRSTFVFVDYPPMRRGLFAFACASWTLAALVLAIAIAFAMRGDVIARAARGSPVRA